MLLLELFDIQKPLSNEEYISKIDNLISKINHFLGGYTMEYFLNKHTPSPLYTPFINNKIHSSFDIPKVSESLFRTSSN